MDSTPCRGWLDGHGRIRAVLPALRMNNRLRSQDAQSPGQHPRPEYARGLEDLTVHVRRDLLRELDPDLPRPRQVYLRVLQERSPERSRYEPQDLGPAHLL